MRRRLFTAFATLAVVGALAPLPAAAAAAAAAPAAGPAVQQADTFSCRASGLRVKTPILNSEPIVSNKPGDPCADDTDELLSLAVGSLVKTGLVQTATDLNPGGAQGAQADALVKGTTVNAALAVIKANVLESHASVRCGPNGPVLSGSSKVAGLTINGTPINVIDQPLTIPAGPLLVVAINEQTKTADTITQRALHVKSALLGIDIAIAESVADIHGSPCQAPPPKQCSDGVDNADPEDTKVDAADPGCHTDGNADNPSSYDPNDDDETDVDKPQCSDNADNDGDGKTDANDPGCHTDGDPGNPSTYDPNDDDETDVGKPECSDQADNDGDTWVDTDDPGCHTDGDDKNPATYDPNDDDESDR